MTLNFGVSNQKSKFSVWDGGVIGGVWEFAYIGKKNPKNEKHK